MGKLPQSYMKNIRNLKKNKEFVEIYSTSVIEFLRNFFENLFCVKNWRYEDDKLISGHQF